GDDDAPGRRLPPRIAKEVIEAPGQKGDRIHSTRRNPRDQIDESLPESEAEGAIDHIEREPRQHEQESEEARGQIAQVFNRKPAERAEGACAQLVREMGQSDHSILPTKNLWTQE